MTEVLLIVAICLAAISIVLAIIILIRLSKRKEDAGASIDLKPIEESLAEVKGSLPFVVKTAVTEQMKADAEAENKRAADLRESVGKAMMENAENDNKRLIAFQERVNQQLLATTEALTKKIDEQMKAIDGKVNESLQNGFRGTSDSMEKLQKALGAIEVAQNNIQTLSTDVLSLKGILTNNQQRGQYGEMQLEMAVRSMFGDVNEGTLYAFQYTYQAGGKDFKPDAVIFLDDQKKKIVCIDSKFSIVGYEGLFGDKPLEEEQKKALKAQFKSAVQLRVKEVTKYVESGKVMTPAILFVPNDGVFAYLELEFPEVILDARSKDVVLASPTILQPIIAAFRMVQIDEARAKNLGAIKDALAALGAEFNRFQGRWKKLEANIDTVGKSTKDLGTTVSKITKRFDRISSSGSVDPIESEDIAEFEELDS